MSYKKTAEKGKRFVLTKKGYEKTPDRIKTEREIGKPIKGYENSVPVSWVENGYVTEQKNAGATILSTRQYEKNLCYCDGFVRGF